MANAQKDPESTRKFFFDLHNFDDPNATEEAAPPPPVYSQEELEAAKTLALEQGRQKGHNEADASREQKIALLVQQISAEFATLFAAEQEREMRYEHEVVLLTLTILEKLFPAMNAQIGPSEARQAIQKILKSAAGQSEITIRIHPSFTADIEAIVAPFRNKEVNPPSFHIVGDDTLAEGACKLAWADGGAVRDADALAAGIKNALMDLLPAEMVQQGTAAQNNDITEEVPAESPSGEPAQDKPGESDE